MATPTPRRVRKMPIQQLFILSLCRFSEPLTMTSTFPYIPEMIESLGVPKNDVAKWAGISTSCFAISQGFTAIMWVRMSDRYGRKPAIMFGLFNSMLFSLIWGFSSSLPMAMVARALTGAGSGNVGILRTMISELVPWKEFQPQAFSVMPLVYNIGSIIGPIIGGSLANPTHRKPGEPATDNFFSRFPYAMPNMVNSCFFLLSICIGVLFLHESHPVLKHRPDHGLALGRAIVRKVGGWKNRLLCTVGQRQPESESETDDDQQALLRPELQKGSSYQSITDEECAKPGPTVDQMPEPAAWRDILTLQAMLNLLAYTLLGMQIVAFDQLIPVFLHHTRQDANDPAARFPFMFGGGFGFDTETIGRYFTTIGAISMFFQFFCYPKIAGYFGVLRAFQISMWAYPFIFIATPLVVLLPTDRMRHVGLVIVWTAKAFCGAVSFPSAFIMLANSSKSQAAIASLNGISTSTVAFGRSISPLIAGQAFSFGAKNNFVLFPFILTSILGIAAGISTTYMIESDKSPFDDDSDDEEDYGEGSSSPLLLASSSSSDDEDTPVRR